MIMKMIRVINLILIILILSSFKAYSHPLFYSAKEINGAVVDGETGKPLEGVVVVAQWVYWCPGGGHYMRIKVIEAVTDKDGRYHIPGWGPRLRRPFCYLDYRDPQLSIFKGGYLYKRLFNKRESNAYLRISDWDGKVIGLWKAQSEKKYWEDVRDFQLDIDWGNTNWKKIKQAVFAIERERKNKPDKYHLSGLPDDARKILFKE